jgi:hypothetical protein
LLVAGVAGEAAQVPAHGQGLAGSEDHQHEPVRTGLLELPKAQGLSVAKLADRISQMSGAPEMSGEELLALMTAEPGEELAGLMNAFDEAVVYQN